MGLVKERKKPMMLSGKNDQVFVNLIDFFLILHKTKAKVIRRCPLEEQAESVSLHLSIYALPPQILFPKAEWQHFFTVGSCELKSTSQGTMV